MKFEVIEEKENPLLERKEIVVRVMHDGATPSIKEIREKLCAQMSLDKDSTIVDNVKSKFGMSESIAFIKVYKSRDRMISIETDAKIKKNFPEEIKSG